MGYQVLYRTYRPSKFDEVVGQEYIIKTLKNAIKLNKVAHAYLFAGPRGTGKTTIAKLFAKAINCENFKEEACDNCKSCISFNEGNHPDIIEMDAASNNSVEDIRKIVEEIPYAPLIAKYKVYIIDEVHMLSQSAFNALLKTLEEPPEHAVFILATTDPQKVIPTVLSRCQRYNFSKISTFDIKKKMKEILKNEKIKFEEKALDEIAVLAEGGMRDALSILEQILSYNSEGVTLEDVQKIFGLTTVEEKINLLINTHTQNINDVIKSLRDIYNAGIDIKRLTIDLLEIIKETLIYSDKGSNELLEKLSAVNAQEILNVTGTEILLNDIKCLQDTLTKSYSTQNFLSYLELCLIEMSKDNLIKVEAKPNNKKIIKEIKKEEVKEKEIKEEFKEAKTEKQIDPIDEMANEDNSNIDLDFIAKILCFATKEDKINDAVIFNRMELYKYESDNRKYYELLNETELFAASNDAIIISCNKEKADAINYQSTNEDLFNFIYKEFGISKMIYALSKDDIKTCVNKYKALSSEEKAIKPEIKKYETKKPRTTEDKLKELFGDVTVE